MPMDETTIKTNLGLILQSVLARAIEEAGFAAIQNFQYEPTCEKPDFLIPNSKSPKFMIEVHQTEARNSFQMKTLRAFTAVTESKAFYGNGLISVNVLFGDPATELPASNVRALFGVFDVNLVPRVDADDVDAISKLEHKALLIASDEKYRNRNVEAAAYLIGRHAKAVATIAGMIKTALVGAKARKSMFPLWQLERVRVSGMGSVPPTGLPTYYKSQMLRSMYINDSDFETMSSEKDSSRWPDEINLHLTRVKLGTITEDVDGDHFHIDQAFQDFLDDAKSGELRSLCKGTLDSSDSMRCFFEDIRDRERRRKMASHFFSILSSGADLGDEIMSNIGSPSYGGIDHRRCWIVDCVARYLGVSHNRMNSALRDLGADVQNLGNPFNQLSYKSARFMSDPDTHLEYATGVKEAFENLMGTDEVDVAPDVIALEERLLELRLDGANKLRKLDPLYLVIGQICAEFDITLGDLSIRTIISDLASSVAAGRFELATLEYGGKIVLLNAVAVRDQNGDHKSKEWGARRFATLYRMAGGKVAKSEFVDGLFVIDGDWEDKHIARLHRAGWNHICRLGELEAELKSIFDLKPIARSKKKIKLIAAASEAYEDA